MSEKRILCYGDSNTWGFLPGGAGRLCADQRWTGVCRRELGEGYTVVECGLNGRTTIYDNPNVKFRNGADALPFALLENMPLDLAVLMLGSNDSGITDLSGVVAGVDKMVHMLLTADEWVTGSQKVWLNREPNVLLMSPVYIHDDHPSKERVEISHALAGELEKVAKKYGVHFMDAAKFASPSEVDCVHICPEDHPNLGRAVAEKIRSIFEDKA